MKKIKMLLLIFISLLIISGLTAFPLRTETIFLMTHLHWFPEFMKPWIVEVYDAVAATPDVVLYGTDWLAFAHIIISLFFIPVFYNPIKYQINLKIGMLACLSVFPLAFVCGVVRGIPFFHQLIDCCFGIGGVGLLWIIYLEVKKLERRQHGQAA